LDFVDVHVHLPTYPDPLQVVGAARATRTTLVSCTVNPGEAEVNLRLKRSNPGSVRCFLGVHPSEAGPEAPSGSLEGLMGEADGVGEIGLDTKYSETSPGSQQMNAFLDQLAMAERSGKPVEVHSRGSEKVCLEILGSFRLRSVLMHWFEGEDCLQEVASKGYYVSVGPAILYSKRVRRVATGLSIDRILTESDGPVSFGPIGGRSGPSLIPSVLFSLSEVKMARFEEMGAAVAGNLREFLGDPRRS
jgi:TatD DNase family protein